MSTDHVLVQRWMNLNNLNGNATRVSQGELLGRPIPAHYFEGPLFRRFAIRVRIRVSVNSVRD